MFLQEKEITFVKGITFIIFNNYCIGRKIFGFWK